MDLAALAAIAGGANADAVACAAREADWRARLRKIRHVVELARIPLGIQDTRQFAALKKGSEHGAQPVVEFPANEELETIFGLLRSSARRFGLSRHARAELVRRHGDE